MKRCTGLAVLLLVVLSPAWARSKTAIKIGPGPAAMSQEERAIEADPAAGIEHGVILLEETELDESSPTRNVVSFHVRAKILSNEGRDLGNVEIPINVARGALKQWWGRTILPDGTVRELRQDQLEQQAIVEGPGTKERRLRAALPGVEPGCVIDYGYVAWSRGSFSGSHRVPLQRAWPIRELRYRWQPFDGLFPAAALIHGGEQLEIRMSQGKKSVVIHGNELPPVAEEPHMPPDGEVRATAHLYYLFGSEKKPDDFWDARAKEFERRTKSFARKKRPIEQALASMRIPEEADLRTKLQAAYDWIGSNIENQSLRTAEQIEAAGDEEDEKNTAAFVLESGKGDGFQLDRLFVAFARMLGAEADMVLAVDRRWHYWKRKLLSIWQFDSTLVAVRLPGQTEFSFVDPGSGLPYGQVPWWLAGVEAMQVTRRGAEVVTVPASESSRNVSDTRVKIAFSDDNESWLVSWSRSGEGQCGYEWRRALRNMDPRQRQDRLYDLCGESTDFQIDVAEAPDLADPTASFRLSCSGEHFTSGIRSNVGHYSLTVGGPWFTWVPELSDPERVHPVVFRFRRTERVEVEMQAPHGFAPMDPPSFIELESPYGRYQFAANRTADGFLVERVLELNTLGAMPEHYAELAEFLKEVRRSDDTRVEFERVREGAR